MKAYLKEVKDAQGNIVLAIITLLVQDQKKLNEARVKLNIYISDYIGGRGHNIYLHTEADTISAVITFDSDKIEGRIIDIGE